MASTSSGCGRKRPLQAVSESSSSTSTFENEPNPKPKLCGACLNPLDSPPLPQFFKPQESCNLAGFRLHKMVVTCKNYKNPKSACNAVLHTSSPHFHFNCSGIPTGSKLFSDVIQNLEKNEVRKKTDDSSITHIPLPALNREPTSTMQFDENVISSGFNSNENKEERCEAMLEICPVDYNGTIVSPPTSRRGSFETNKNKACIQPFKVDDQYNFLCPFCDVQGSSQYLQEYFSNFRTQKIEYYGIEGSRDFPPLNLYRNKIRKSGGDNKNRKDYCFMDYLIQQQQKLGFPCANTELQLDHIQNIIGCIHHCENDVQDVESDEADYVDTTKVADLLSLHKNKHKSEGCCPTNLGRFDNDFMKTKAGKYKTNEGSPVNITCLVGQPIRLFCRTSNVYHVGRIIDWRLCDELNLFHAENSAENKKRHDEFVIDSESCMINQNLIIDQDIGRTQFLIRFRAGIEGRKVAVHEWLFLEEHPLMVGLNLVWAKSDNDKCGVSRYGKNEDNSVVVSKSCDHHLSNSRNKLKKNGPRYRPAQIFVRSALEIKSLPKLNVCVDKAQDSMSQIKALALFFGKTFRCKVLRLRHHDRPPTENYFCGGIEDDSSCNLEKIIVADFKAPPKNLKCYLRKLQCNNAALVVTTTLASMEIEERYRILLWLKLAQSIFTIS